MKGSKNTITTLSTLEGSKTQISSSKYIIPSAFQMFSPKNQQRHPQRIISILHEDSHETLNQVNQIQITVNNQRIFSKNKSSNMNYDLNTRNIELANILGKIFFKKKRYCFQVLKQFYLFQDQSQSSICSLSTYDPLIFKDQIIHSLVKIMQTQLIQNKIWAFLNLKMMPYLKAAIKIQEKATKIQQKTIKLHKKVSFQYIKRAAEDAFSAIIKQRSIIKESRYIQLNNTCLQTQNKEIQCVFQQKKSKTSYLSSNLIQQQIRPVIKIKSEIQPVQNTTRIYTRQQYELKYGKMKQNNQPKVIRLEPIDLSHKNSQCNQNRTTNIINHVSQYRVPTQTIVKKQNYITSEIEKTKQSRSPKKYNIIHYHQRPRQIMHPISIVQQRYHSMSTQEYQSCCQSCCTCEHSCVIQNRTNCHAKSYCEPSYYEKYDKSDMINETRMTDHVKIINGQKSAKNILLHNSTSNYELSELQSRIQYLNFLRNLVKDQEHQSIL